MASRVRIFDKGGAFLEELDVKVARGFIRNEVSEAKFSIALNDAKCTRRVLEYGNILLVEHQDGDVSLPPWIGTIETPRDWTYEGINVNAKTPEHLLDFRFAPYMPLVGTMGSWFAECLAYANIYNVQGETKFVEGSIFNGGHTMDKTTKDLSMLHNIERAQEKSSGAHWTFTPSFTPDGLLTIAGNWFPRETVVSDLLITEGKNIVEQFGVSMSEQGDFVNRAEVFYDVAGVAQPADKMVKENPISRSAYGLRMGVEHEENKNALEARADSVLIESAEPKRTYTLAVHNGDGETFGMLRIGVLARLVMSRVGFSKNGFGTDTTVRVDSIEFSDEMNRAVLTVNEVYL